MFVFKWDFDLLLPFMYVRNLSKVWHTTCLMHQDKKKHKKLHNIHLVFLTVLFHTAFPQHAQHQLLLVRDFLLWVLVFFKWLCLPLHFHKGSGYLPPPKKKEQELNAILSTMRNKTFLFLPLLWCPNLCIF